MLPCGPSRIVHCVRVGAAGGRAVGAACTSGPSSFEVHGGPRVQRCGAGHGVALNTSPCRGLKVRTVLMRCGRRQAVAAGGNGEPRQAAGRSNM